MYNHRVSLVRAELFSSLPGKKAHLQLILSGTESAKRQNPMSGAHGCDLVCGAKSDADMHFAELTEAAP
jgi:hypothetical protein